MSEATVPQPDADNDWDTIDEAVRGQLGQFLTSGTDLFNGSDLMGRLDPLSLFSPLLRTSLSAASRPDKIAGAVSRAAGEMIRGRPLQPCGPQAVPRVRAEARQRQTLLRSGLE